MSREGFLVHSQRFTVKGSWTRVHGEGFTVKYVRLVVYGREHQGTRRVPRVTLRVDELRKELGEWLVVLDELRSTWTVDFDS